MRSSLVLYVPVLHEGYLKIFRKYNRSVDGLYLLGDDIVADFFPFQREIRALDTVTAKKAISSLGLFRDVSVLHKKTIKEFHGAEIVTAEDEICRSVMEKYLPENRVSYENIFLRWDSANVKTSVTVKYDRVSRDPFDRKMMALAANEAEKSSDWWRHVGTVVTKGKKVILQNHNHHIPSDHMPYTNGDPRDVIESGTMNLVYSSLHAEQSAVADAALRGISLKGTNMYLNVFPCPLCAKLIAHAGVKKCFFKTGAAWLDAESVLKAKNVEIVLVK
jgi:dCMP deaminase